MTVELVLNLSLAMSVALALLCIASAVLLYIEWVQSACRVIGENYLTRYFLIPRNRFFNIYLHKFTGSDDDRALHDHPWYSMSILLKGRIQEHRKVWKIDRSSYDLSPNVARTVVARSHVQVSAVWRWIPKFRSAHYAHRLEVITPTAWTLFITGPAIRQWGFHCPKGWVHWRAFTDETGNGIGKGCD
jgi:hypothetical protein